MNTQGHFSLLYNVIPYKVFFGRKYCDCANSLTTIKKASPNLIKFIDEQINDAVNKNLPIIDEIMEKYIKHEIYNKDKKEDTKNNKEEDTKKDRGENRKTEEEKVEDKQGNKKKKAKLKDEEKMKKKRRKKEKRKLMKKRKRKMRKTMKKKIKERVF